MLVSLKVSHSDISHLHHFFCEIFIFLHHYPDILGFRFFFLFFSTNQVLFFFFFFFFVDIFYVNTFLLMFCGISTSLTKYNNFAFLKKSGKLCGMEVDSKEKLMALY